MNNTYIPSIAGYLSVPEFVDEVKDFALYGVLSLLSNIPEVSSVVAEHFHVNASYIVVSLVFARFVYKRWATGMPIEDAIRSGVVTVAKEEETEAIKVVEEQNASPLVSTEAINNITEALNAQ